MYSSKAICFSLNQIPVKGSQNFIFPDFVKVKMLSFLNFLMKIIESSERVIVDSLKNFRVCFFFQMSLLFRLAFHLSLLLYFLF